MSITRHLYILILTIGIKECNERIILVNYGHNQMVGFRDRRGQNLVKVGQTQSNLIDGLETTRLCEIHIRILIIGIEEYGDILVLVKFENNWMIRLREMYIIYVHHALSLDLKSNCWIQRVKWNDNSSKLWSQSNGKI